MKFDKITLITDFGDFYPGVVKCSIYSVLKFLNHNAEVVDITHKVEPFNVLHGAFLLLNYYKYLRAVHCAVVDPTVGSRRKAVAIVCRKHVFVGPNNGLLYPAAEEAGIKEVYEISNKKAFDMLKKSTEEEIKISTTFHGRDVFAPASAFAASGRIDEIAEVVKFTKLKKLNLFDVKIDKNTCLCKVVCVDRFGNLITNLKREMVDNIKGFYISNYYFPLVERITSVKEGEKFAIIGSFGVVEFCVRNGSAFDFLKSKVKGINLKSLKLKFKR